MPIPEAMTRQGGIVAIEPAASETEENACVGNFVLNCDGGNGFNSVLRDGFINIEPIDDNVALGCEDENLGELHDCFRTANAVQPITIAPVGDEGTGTYAVHPECAGTVDPLSLRPPVLQEIARSFQTRNISNGVTGCLFAVNSVSEFSCSEDETVESGGHASGTTKDRNKIDNKSGEKSQASLREDLDDCVISRVDKRGSKSLGSSTGDGEVVVVSADVSASRQKSGRNSFSNPAFSPSPNTSSNNAVVINLDKYPHGDPMPSVGSSSTASTPSELHVKASSGKRPNFGGKTVGAKKITPNKTPVLSPSNKTSIPKKSSVLKNAASSCRTTVQNTSVKSSTASTLVPSVQNRLSINDLATGVTAGVRCRNSQHPLNKAGSNTGCLDGGHQWTSGNVQTLKRKSAGRVDGPQHKIQKLKAKTFKKNGQKTQKW